MRYFKFNHLPVTVLLFLLSALSLSAYDYASVNRKLGVPLLPAGKGWDFQRTVRELRQRRVMLRGDKLRMSARPENLQVLGAPLVELQIFSADGRTLSGADLIFVNKGDSDSRGLSRRIRRTNLLLQKNLNTLLGAAKGGRFGPDGQRSKAQFWRAGEWQFILESVRNEYVILHIRSTQRSSGAVRERDFTANVKRNDFGDVVIHNVPMVDQGPKGYCVTATAERIFRYYGFEDIDMHRLADAAKSSASRGTSMRDFFRGVSDIRRGTGLKWIQLGDASVNTVRKYIDRGWPVIWLLRVNEDYETLRHTNTARRKDAESPRQWKRELNRGRPIPRSGGGHACLILGYNPITGEIAVSNSWGEREIIPSWVPERVARRVSQGVCYVLAPR